MSAPSASSGDSPQSTLQFLEVSLSTCCKLNIVGYMGFDGIIQYSGHTFFTVMVNVFETIFGLLNCLLELIPC